MRRVGSVFFGVLLGLLVLADGATDQLDISALNTLFSSLNSPGQLTGWSLDSQGDPCGQQWKGVTCSGSSVTELHLDGLGLNGALSYNLDNFKSLTVLVLINNNIGGQMQYHLPPNLKMLDLSGNQLTGGLPYSISELSSLEYLSVSRNQFKDPLSDVFSKLSSLSTIDLSQNAFTGSLPGSFRALSSLTTLYLQNNQFTGTIDVLGDLPLENLNIANNRFTGWIPGQLRKIKNFQSDGNQWNSGPAPPPPPFTPPPSPKGNRDQESDGKTSGSGGKSGLSGGGIAGIIIAVLVVGSIVAFFLIKRKSKRSHQTEEHEQRQGFTSVPSDENAGAKHFQIDVDPVAIVHIAPSPINIAPPMDGPKSSDEDDSTNQPVTNNINKFNTKAIAFSIADLQMATGSFSIDNLIGEGSIGRVYRAQFDDGKVLAVKKINSLGISQQASEGFMKVISDVSQLHHPNVTELIGYCCEHGQYLLLYEFHRNGSLHDFLHLSDVYSKPLTWKTRVKIALGTARALEYLHEVCSPSIVHKNFKSANILLDAELNPHLSDCGLSSLASDDYQALDQYLGSGYSAPEVAMTGQYTLKSDVFSFGVVMLELLTGRKPFDSSRSRLEQSLVRWATPQLHDIDALDKMVDPALKGLYPAKSLSRFADAIALCVQSEPEFRPPMSEVVQALVRLVQRTNMSTRMGDGDEQGRGDDANTDMF